MADAAGSDRRLAGLVFAAALAVYWANGDVQPGHDPRANVALPANLLHHGRLTFTPQDWPGMFVWSARPDGARVLERAAYFLAPTVRTGAAGERLYAGTYGIGSGLTALPVYAVATALGADLHQPRTRWHLGKLAASLCVAGAIALVFLIARWRLPPAPALWVAVAAGFGTCAWSSSSQALWQHGPSELFLVLGTWALLHPAGSAWLRAAAGAAYGWAVLCRPTGLVVLAAAGLWLLASERRRAWAYAAAAAPFLLGLAAYNAWYFGSPLAFGQLADAAAPEYRAGDAGLWATPFWLGAAGQLLSPSRGVLVYSPVVAAALWGIWRAWRAPGDAAFRAVSVIALALLCADMKWSSWWGGWSYGYRLKADAVLLLALLLVPAMPELLRRPLARLAFLLALAWSIAVQALGAFAYDFEGWNARLYYAVAVPGRSAPLLLEPAQAARVGEIPGAQLLQPVRASVDDPAFRHRLWSLGDSQILYHATHLAESRANRRRVMQAIWDRDRPP